MTPNERALNATQILENPVFIEALTSLEERLVSSWKATQADQWKARERLYDQLVSLHDVRHQLETYIATAALDSTAR